LTRQPFGSIQGGVLQQQPPNEEGGGLQPLTRGQGVLPPGGLEQQPLADQGAAEEPSTTEGTQPATVEVGLSLSALSVVRNSTWP
jgi:hypothetical protein